MELAGHELRTPVTYIIGVCGLAQRQMQQGPAAPATEEEGQITTTARTSAAANAALQKIALKAQRLAKIIENLLKLVNNDQFTTRLNKQPIDMRALVLQVCNDHRPFVVERKQQLIVDVAENLPTLDGDRDKLEDVLTNLISNAIRFSPDGGTITVAAHPVMGDMLEILVCDSGTGIPEKDLAELFEPFYTGSDVLHHTSGTFEYGSKGIGLGLAIVRRFVEIHGGAVKAYPGNPGTRFQILLPLPSRDDPLPAALPTPTK
jgi:signal transduction histidine kinase